MSIWRIHLPLALVSQNDRRARNDKHGHGYRKLRDDFCLFLRASVRRNRIPTEPPIRPGQRRSGRPLVVGRRSVVIDRLYSGREQPFDIGNLVGGAKGLVDAMVLEGILFDDSEEWFTGIYAQRSAPESGVLLTIEDDRA